MSGWLDLTQLGLAPNQKHQALLGAPKMSTVGCHGYMLHSEALTRQRSRLGVSGRLGRFLQVLQETEHLWRGRQKKLSAVGLPVTWQPPHRSRRAVFPHRALREYSLPQQD